MVKKIFLIFLTVLFIGLASASFSVGNASHSIQKTYAPNGAITGWINISFSDESLNSLFKDSEGNSITLKDLIEKNNNYDYTCNPEKCGNDYSAENGATTKTFELKNGESISLGIKLDANIEGISSVNFDVESDATSSCVNQLKIKLFESDDLVFGNNKSLKESCPISGNYGCFDGNLATNQYEITTTSLCQKINLTESPGFELGAWVKETEIGNKNITMTLYNSYGDNVKSCDLSGISSSGSEVSCNISYQVTSSEEYYVCISGDVGNGKYDTKGYSSSNGCGFSGTPPIQGSAPGAYQIFAKGQKFDDFGTLGITNDINGEDLGNEIEDYILGKYNSLDCSSECVIPIEFISGKDQTITLRNLNVYYMEKNLGSTSERDFYNISKTEAKINSGFQKFYLDGGGFSAPASYGNKTFTLNLNNQKIFSETISVSNVIPSINGISPLTTAAAFPTKFRVNVNSSSSISKYEWKFGNDSKITTKNEIVYAYPNIGKYSLEVKVTDLNGKSSSKTFNIDVVSPKEAINFTLNKDFENLDKIKSQINNMTGFYKTSLMSLFDTELIEELLNTIKADYGQASTDSEYIGIMGELANIRIPQSISTSKVANSIPFYPETSGIDIDVVKNIGGGDYGSYKSEYSEAVLAWQQENINLKINYREISADYEEGRTSLLNFFELDSSEKNSLGYDYYLFINLNNVSFEGNYGQKTQGTYTYILNPKQKIVFSTTEEVDFTNLPAFVSPSITKLSIETGSSTGIGDVEGRGWGLFIAIMVGLLIVAIIVYIIMQQWYKNKYETYLFKDRNNLFNLISYIDSARKKGFSEEQINEKLRQAGWNSEQREYALKKYAGKRTGMLELPITTILDKLKKAEGKNIQQGRIPRQ